MLVVNNQKNYSTILMLDENLSKSESQLLAYNYAKFLKSLGALDISASLKSDFKVSYPIKKRENVKFVEFLFSCSPAAIAEYRKKLSIDESILRFFILSKD